MPDEQPTSAEQGEFLASLMDTELYSIGAYFCDEHPDLVDELIGGVQQDGAYIGSPDAPVTIGVFNDLQCSTCRGYELHTIDPLIGEYARGGSVRLEFHNFSLGATDTTVAAYAAVAAGVQDS